MPLDPQHFPSMDHDYTMKLFYTEAQTGPQVGREGEIDRERERERERYKEKLFPALLAVPGGGDGRHV